jgi:hypothetical protein
MNKEWLQAYENIQKFIEDCEIELHIIQTEFISDEKKRYTFILESNEVGNYTVKITMPSLPLEKLRYIEEKDQDVYNYYRILVNDSSWLWKYALITRKKLISNFEDNIETLKEKINYYQECINDLKGE